MAAAAWSDVDAVRGAGDGVSSRLSPPCSLIVGVDVPTFLEEGGSELRSGAIATIRSLNSESRDCRTLYGSLHGGDASPHKRKCLECDASLSREAAA